MRRLLFVLVLAGCASAGSRGAAGKAVTSTSHTYDLLIRGGHIVDGTGSPWYAGDVAITGDRIAAIGRIGSVRA